VSKYSLECLGRHDLGRRFFPSREEALIASRDLCEDVVVRESTLEDVFINLTGERIDA